MYNLWNGIIGGWLIVRVCLCIERSFCKNKFVYKKKIMEVLGGVLRRINVFEKNLGN